MRENKQQSILHQWQVASARTAQVTHALLERGQPCPVFVRRTTYLLSVTGRPLWTLSTHLCNWSGTSKKHRQPHAQGINARHHGSSQHAPDPQSHRNWEHRGGGKCCYHNYVEAQSTSELQAKHLDMWGSSTNLKDTISLWHTFAFQSFFFPNIHVSPPVLPPSPPVSQHKELNTTQGP